MIWSPLRGGWLTGKYHRDMNKLPDGRVKNATEGGWSEAWEVYNNDRTWNILDVVEKVAEETGYSMAQVSLNWLLQRPGVTTPIIGVRTMAHLEGNLEVSEQSLSDDQMQRLNEASEMRKPYPYSFIRSRRD